MEVLSFASVREGLTGDTVPEVYVCIAVERNTRCTTQIEARDLALAIEHFQKDNVATNVLITRSIIDWLVCAKHRTYTTAKDNTLYIKRIEATWKDEFPAEYFRSPRSPRQPSRKGATKASPRSRTPTIGSRNGVVRSTPPSTQSDCDRPSRQSNSLGSPSPRTQRAVSDSGIVTSPSRSLIPRILAEDIDMLSFATDDISQDVPLVNGPVTNTQMLEGSVTTQSCAGDLAAASTQVEIHLVPAVRADAGEAGTQSTRSSRRRGISTTQCGFESGEMSYWSAQSAHDEMKALLGQPLESATATGYLYIFPEVNKRYVKIGFTTGKLWDRFKNIENSCKSVTTLKLDYDSRRSVPNIPYLQLLRLEKLVHTDLAHFHRHLHVKSSGRKRTQHEWFEIDPESAYQTVSHWWNVMRSYKMSPGQPLKEGLISLLEIEANAVATSVANITDVDDAWWRVHTDNGTRLKKWKAILPHKSRSRPGDPWMWLALPLLVCVLLSIGSLVAMFAWHPRIAACLALIIASVMVVDYVSLLEKCLVIFWKTATSNSSAG